MDLRKITGIFVCTLLLGVSSFAMAGIPELGNCEAAFPNYSGAEVALFNLPNGGGSPFTTAQVIGTSDIVDASIIVTLRDGNDAVIPNFPAEDVWLESVDGGMVPCLGGATADLDTDADGETQFVNAMSAGGSSMANCTVMVSGDAITGGANSGVFALRFNSADINGDGIVNLSDISDFSSVFYGAYDFSADFFADGVVNLSDVQKLAAGNGAACP